MPSWFDLYHLQIGGREDSEGIKRVVKEIGELLRLNSEQCVPLVIITSMLFIVSEMVAEEEADGIPSNRVIIGGFSQGTNLVGHVYLLHLLVVDFRQICQLSIDIHYRRRVGDIRSTHSPETTGRCNGIVVLASPGRRFPKGVFACITMLI